MSPRTLIFRYPSTLWGLPGVGGDFFEDAPREIIGLELIPLPEDPVDTLDPADPTERG